MDEKLRQEIMRALDDAARMAGAPDWNTGVHSLVRLSLWILMNSESMRAESLIETFLAGSKESDGEGGWKVQIVRQLFADAPTITSRLLSELAKKAKESLPADKGGRPNALTADQGQAICGMILQLYGQGVPLEEAKRRAAERFGVGLRTAERAWRERGSHTITSADLSEFVRSILSPDVTE